MRRNVKKLRKIRTIQNYEKENQIVGLCMFLDANVLQGISFLSLLPLTCRQQKPPPYLKFRAYTRAVQKVSDLNFFRLNKSSTGSVLHCGCGGDIYAHA